MAAERNTTSFSGEHKDHGRSGLGLTAAELRGLPEGSVVGYAAGAFDLFHVGHLNILRQAKRHCDYLIAGVVSDEMLEVTKGRAPVVPAAERAEIVSHVKFVDEVCTVYGKYTTSTPTSEKRASRSRPRGVPFQSSPLKNRSNRT